MTPTAAPILKPTDRRRLGRTDIHISPIGFGCSPLGGVFGDIVDDEAIDAVHEAYRQGINFFDTSPFYGVTRSEKVLGRALAGLPREELVVASKVGRYSQNEFDFSADRVTRSVEESLERLQLEYLDIVQCHDVEFGDLDQVANETLPALQKLKDSGKIRALGITGLPLHIFPHVLDRSRVEIDLVLSYCHYCLNDSALSELVPFLEDRGVGVINASPLCMGLLTPSGGPSWHPAPPELKSAARRANALCESRSAALPTVALQYALRYKGVTSTLVGIDSVPTLQQDLQAASQPVDDELLADVLEIFAPVHNTSWASGRAENRSSPPQA